MWTLVKFLGTFASDPVFQNIGFFKGDLIPNIEREPQAVKAWTEIGGCGRHADFNHG